MVLIIMMAGFHKYGQSNAPIPADLLTNKTPADEIAIHRRVYKEPLFSIDIDSRIGSRGDGNLVASGKELYYLPDGTGRVYRIDSTGAFTRIDSTYYTRYNFGAYTFSYRDTIYSLSGYGFWNYNGHLRFFRSDKHGWEIELINRELPVLINNPLMDWSLWFNKKHGNLIYPARSYARIWSKNLYSDGLTDTFRAWKLDLNKKKWSILGTLNKETASLINTGRRVFSLPSGELFLHPTNKQEITLLDYRSNQVKRLNQKKSEAINSFIQQADVDNNRVFIYRRDSTLNFHVSEERKLVLHLTESNFKVNHGCSIVDLIDVAFRDYYYLPTFRLLHLLFQWNKTDWHPAHQHGMFC